MLDDPVQFCSVLSHYDLDFTTFSLLQVEEAKAIAKDQMGVEFIDVDVQAFKDKVSSVQQEMLDENESIRDLYDHIQQVNEKYAKEGES